VKGGVDKVRESLAGLATLAGRVAAEQAEEIAAIAERYETTLRGGGTLFFAGNGGSAADAQHLAGEMIGRLNYDRAPAAAIALTTDTSALTAIANDYGYECVFERQVLGLGRAGDVLIAISTSGNSPNVIRAVEVAKPMGIATVGLLGRNGGHLGQMVDFPIIVGADETARIQEAHIFLGHVMCALIEHGLGVGGWDNPAN